MPQKKDENADAGAENDILPLYTRLLEEPKQLRRILLAEARCDQGCLLLHVFATPAGTAWGRTARTLRTEPVLNPADPDGPNLPQEPVRRDAAAGLMHAHGVPSGCKHIDYVPVRLDALSLGSPGKPVVNIYRRS